MVGTQRRPRGPDTKAEARGNSRAQTSGTGLPKGRDVPAAGEVRRDDRHNGPRAGRGGTRTVCCPRRASASVHSGVRWALPTLPGGDSAHPTVPVFPRWQAVLTCPWKCSRSCRQAAGVYHCRKTDRQVGMSPCGAPGQELVAYFPGSPPSPSKPPSRPSLSAPHRLQGSNVPGSPGGDPESWVLLGEGSWALALGVSHLCPLW